MLSERGEKTENRFNRVEVDLYPIHFLKDDGLYFSVGRYSLLTEVIYISSKNVTEKELIHTLNHETLHAILHKYVGVEASRELDNLRENPPWW